MKRYFRQFRPGLQKNFASYPLRRVGMAVLTCLALGAGTAPAELQLASVFGDNMVIQRDAPVPVWGSAEPGETVSIAFGGHELTAQADAEGHWESTLKPLPASAKGRSLTLKSQSGEKELELSNILVGDVWLCGGQSNMGLYLSESFGAEEAIAAANLPEIRFFAIPSTREAIPADALANGSWTVCQPDTAAGFAAVAFHFGRVLHEKVEVPIGLIEFDRGATGIEGWVPLAGLAAMPEDLTQELYHRAASWDPNHPIGKKAFSAAFEEIRDWIPAARAALAAGTPVPPEPLVPAPAPTVPGPGELFNGTVNPLIPFAIKGAIWYQGESNPAEGPEYELKMTAMVRGWRELWKQGDFPLYWVQLANEGNPARTPDEDVKSRYVPVREAQRRVLTEPHTGMVVAIDLGEDANGHPRNKKEVGERLALWALAKDYGQATPFSGPLYAGHHVEGNRIIVSFDHIGDGLMVGNKEGPDGQAPVTETPDAPLGHFSISGNDNVWHWADAKIVGDTVEVQSDKVPAPKHIRYAYTMNPKGPKLYNRDGLPASPFSSIWSSLRNQKTYTP